jgi:uncharacterized glyoxalase superfamily protein PhnB
MDAIAVRIVRHTNNFEAMVRFYRDGLGMDVVQSWDRPGNRGALLSPGDAVSDTLIEVLDLNDEAVSGAAPVNVVLSLEVEDVDRWHGQLIGAGVSIARGLEDAPWGHRSFGVDDPGGFRIWIYQDTGVVGGWE